MKIRHISAAGPVFWPVSWSCKEGDFSLQRRWKNETVLQFCQYTAWEKEQLPFSSSWQLQVQTLWKYRRSIWPNIYARTGFNSPVMALGHLFFPDVKAQHFSLCLWQQEAPQAGESYFMYCAYEGEHYVWYRGAAEVFILSLLGSISVCFSLCFY